MAVSKTKCTLKFFARPEQTRHVAKEVRQARFQLQLTVHPSFDASLTSPIPTATSPTCATHAYFLPRCNRRRPNPRTHQLRVFQTFHEHEILTTSKTAVFPIDGTAVGVCLVLKLTEFKRSNPTAQFNEADLYFCHRRYTPASTTIAKIKNWKLCVDGSDAIDLTPREHPRELCKLDEASLLVGKQLTIGGVSTVFVSDADVQVHITNVVKNPPLPVAIYDSSRLAKRCGCTTP